MNAYERFNRGVSQDLVLPNFSAFGDVRNEPSYLYQFPHEFVRFDFSEVNHLFGGKVDPRFGGNEFDCGLSMH